MAFSPEMTKSTKTIFLSEDSRGQHQKILCEIKDHLPKKVTPIEWLTQ